MKKLMISFLAGATLIGVGLGITFLELSDWKTADYPEYLETLDSRQYVTEEPVDMDIIDEVEIYLATMYTNEFRKVNMVKVVEDKACTDRIELEITYKGQQPNIHTYAYDISSSSDEAPTEAEEEQTLQKGQVVIYAGSYDSIAEYKQIVQAMFDEKVFYENMDNCLIEGVTVKTAYPDKIEVR